MSCVSKTNLWKLSTLLLAGALAYDLAGSERTAQAEPQPHMKDALASLRSAKKDLEAASADKGGHRVKALELTKSAIDEVEKGIAYDDGHKSSDSGEADELATPEAAP
ncbi:MAG: hypothetical protein U0271_06500 [Polyangiaceae bacterium]